MSTLHAVVRLVRRGRLWFIMFKAFCGGPPGGRLPVLFRRAPVPTEALTTKGQEDPAGPARDLEGRE